MGILPTGTDWADGRVGIVEAGEYAGYFLLAVRSGPPVDGWQVFVTEDFTAETDRLVNTDDWLHDSTEEAEAYLRPMHIRWLNAPEEDAEEKRVFNLRHTWTTDRPSRAERLRATTRDWLGSRPKNPSDDDSS